MHTHTHTHTRACTHTHTHQSPGPAFSPSSGEELSDGQKHPGSLSLSGSAQSPRRAAPTPPSVSASVPALTKEPAWWATVHGVAEESDRTKRLNSNNTLCIFFNLHIYVTESLTTFNPQCIVANATLCDTSMGPGRHPARCFTAAQGREGRISSTFQITEMKLWCLLTKAPRSQRRGLGSISGQGTGVHTP